MKIKNQGNKWKYITSVQNRVADFDYFHSWKVNWLFA